MDKEKRYLYWLDIAEYDMTTAESMLNSERYLYVVFMCQQALEKLAKGLYCYYIDDKVPRVHSISFIIDRVTEIIGVGIDDETYSLFDWLAAYYIESRYPSYKEKISQIVDKKEASKVLALSKGVFNWMLSLKR